MAGVSGTGPEKLHALAAALREADPLLRRELRRQLAQAAQPVTGEVKQAIRESPSKHGGSLRAEIAATVSSSVSMTADRVRVEIISKGDKMPPGKGELPKLMNRDQPFHHPVFGSRIRAIEADLSGLGHGHGWTWVAQESHARGWFDRTIRAKAPEFQRAAQAAMDEVRRKLEL